MNYSSLPRLLFPAILTALAVPAIASACSYPATWTSAVLGFVDYQIPSGSFAVPRNLAVFSGATTQRPGLSAYTEVTYGDPTLRRLSPMPEAGAELTIAGNGATTDAGTLGTVLVVADYVDSEPPSAPQVTHTRVEADETSGCGTPKCGAPTTELRIVPATDDFSPGERLTYAVHIGATASAATLSAPVGYQVPHAGTDDLLVLQTRAAGQFVVVQAVDQAGNRSAFSAPVRVARSSRGCDAGGAPVQSAMPLVVVLLAGSVRRLRRRWSTDRPA